MPAENHISPAKMVMVVDDDCDFCWVMNDMLSSEGLRIISVQDGQAAMEQLKNEIPDLILLDYRLPGENGIDILCDLKNRYSAVPVIMITAYADIEIAVKAMKIGAYDYVSKPVDKNDFLFTIKRALERQDLERKVKQLSQILNQRFCLHELMGKSDHVEKIVRLVEKVAPTTLAVMIEGESGTGKELVARSIHDAGERSQGPFQAVDCGAIPETLIESELFGYMKGAFTGADENKPGQFELAEGGTLFLDEVGNLSYLAQQKLLRAIQERKVQKLGAKKYTSVDVRIISATNIPLIEHMKHGKFRSDLFFRLKEFLIPIPPLRNRIDDIPYLAKRFLQQAQEEFNKKCAGFSKSALDALTSYPWPGNVRELKNEMKQAVLLCEENASLCDHHFIFNTSRNRGEPPHPRPSPDRMMNVEKSLEEIDAGKSLKEIVDSYANNLENRLIKNMLGRNKGNKSETARRLRIDYKTLYRKIKAHSI